VSNIGLHISNAVNALDKTPLKRKSNFKGVGLAHRQNATSWEICGAFPLQKQTIQYNHLVNSIPIPIYLASMQWYF